MSNNIRTMRIFIFSIAMLLFLSCKTEVEKGEIEKNKINEVKIDPKKAPESNTWNKLSFEEQLTIYKNGTSADSILSNDIEFINNFILKGKFKLDISNYENVNKKNKCFPIRRNRKMFYEFYNEGFKNLGDLNGDKKEDNVFVLPALSYCEDGDSYYFTDNRIPRLQTDSYCCHPESIFSIGDIDEDGNNEIAQYYSSCASNYKSFYIWTLKENKWKLVENFVYFFDNGKYEVFKDFHKLHKKVAKNKFKFLEISNRDAKGKLIEEWKTVIMK